MKTTTTDFARLSVAWIAAAVLMVSCGRDDATDGSAEGAKEKTRAEAIIDSAIAFHGGDAYDRMNMSFNFRGTVYNVEREAGRYNYIAQYSDSAGRHRRELSNGGFQAFLDGERTRLSAKDSAARAETVNSVVYFVMLPAPLQDEAVQSEYVGTEELDGRSYYKVRVTFAAEGGGQDHEDVYLYWFDTLDYSMDYLAYSFKVNDGGTRFRRAFNSRRLNGFLFQDYVNYRGPADPDSLPHIADLYRAGELDSLSTVAIDSLRFIATD